MESSIEIKNTYDINENQIYARTSIDAIEGLKVELSNRDASISALLNEIIEIKKEIEKIKETSYHDVSINNKISTLESNILQLDSSMIKINTDIYELKGKINNVNDSYNIHLVKQNGLYNIVIENFNENLLSSDYRMVFMKKSRHSKKGKRWTIPMFNDQDISNYYYYNDNGELLTPNKAYWNIKTNKDEIWLGEYSINDLPCLSMKKDNSSFGKKLFVLRDEDNMNISYKMDQTYVFKNSKNKKINIGFAIFKLVDSKWVRISNITEMELYAYNTNKFIINLK